MLAVTHAPQVAARSLSHMRISKGASGKAKSFATRVESLSQEQRREEIARMSPARRSLKKRRAAAARLLQGAG